MLARSEAEAPLNNPNDLIEAYAGLEGRDLIRTIAKDYKGRIALLSSFGADSAVLLHMVSEVDRSIPIIFLDTLKLFPETLAYRDQLVEELGLTNLRILTPNPDDLQRVDPDGNLFEIDHDLCCHFRKSVPMEKAFDGFDVMISGRKRFHGAARADLNPVSIDGDRLKVEPLAGFTALDLQTYMQKHNLPSHPLKLQGYHSIGCMPLACTAPGGSADNPREGRWMGSDKTECGIHFTANGKIIRNVARGPCGLIVERNTMIDIIAKQANSNPSRSIAKAVSWRIVGSLDTAFWGFIFSGSLKIAGSIAFFEVITKIALYYFHERAWAHSRFGLRKIEPLTADET